MGCKDPRTVELVLIWKRKSVHNFEGDGMQGSTGRQFGPNFKKEMQGSWDGPSFEGRMQGWVSTVVENLIS